VPGRLKRKYDFNFALVLTLPALALLGLGSPWFILATELGSFLLLLFPASFLALVGFRYFYRYQSNRQLILPFLAEFFLVLSYFSALLVWTNEFSIRNPSEVDSGILLSYEITSGRVGGHCDVSVNFESLELLRFLVQGHACKNLTDGDRVILRSAKGIFYERYFSIELNGKRYLLL
jgi:hypothetical protein